MTIDFSKPVTVVKQASLNGTYHPNEVHRVNVGDEMTGTLLHPPRKGQGLVMPGVLVTSPVKRMKGSSQGLEVYTNNSIYLITQNTTKYYHPMNDSDYAKGAA